MGHDTHRMVEGGPLRLGGVEIPHDWHLLGHSDADALLHAITDALLGAAGLGDIGELFPDTDEANRDRDSAEMLQIAAQKITESGFSIVNLDATVFAERPKLSPYKKTIQQRIAKILDLSPDCVNIKAKTAEGMGDIGQEKALAVQCVVLLSGRQP